MNNGLPTAATILSNAHWENGVSIFTWLGPDGYLETRVAQSEAEHMKMFVAIRDNGGRKP